MKHKRSHLPYFFITYYITLNYYYFPLSLLQEFLLLLLPFLRSMLYFLLKYFESSLQLFSRLQIIIYTFSPSSPSKYILTMTFIVHVLIKYISCMCISLYIIITRNKSRPNCISTPCI